MGSKVLLDSNVIIALFNRQDSTYERATAVFSGLIEGHVNLLITNLIFVEFSTVLSQRIGKKNFADALKFLAKHQVEEVFLDEKLHNATKKFFETLKNKDISFVDVSSILAMRRYKINRIVTFDKNLGELAKKFGLIVKQ